MQLLRRLGFTMLFMSIMTLVACGGGDLTGEGGDDGGGSSGDEITLSLSLSNSNVTNDEPITVAATLSGGTAAEMSNQLISFDSSLGVFDPDSGTALTDENGVAQIILTAGDVRGAGEIYAENRSGAFAIIGFTTQGDGADDSGATLSLTRSSGDLSLENDISITASLLYPNGSGFDGKLVTFTVNDPTIATFASNITSAVTNEAGEAEISVKVTDIAGGVIITAEIEGEDGAENSVKSIAFDSIGDGVKVVEGEPEAATLRLFASSQQLASSGAQSIELFAIAKDENNNLLEGITINFSSSSGALVNVNGSNVTGADGKVIYELSTQDEPSNRTITATATAGEVTDELDIEVVGTTITLTGSASLALNDATTYIVNVLDSDGNGVASTDVAVFLTGSGADITIPNSVTTDAQGKATILAVGTSGGDNTIVVSALGVSGTQSVSVQSDSFQFTSFSNGDVTEDPSVTPDLSDVSLLKTAEITLTWLRDGSAVASTPVSITTTRGALSSDTATTNSSGEVTFTLTSTDAGKALVTLVGSDTVDGKDIELTNQLEFEFFAETADTITAQASPDSIGPNEQTSVISVVVIDDNGNLVKNKVIKFLLTDISGGSISPATAVTDSSGSASTTYTSNSTSAKDGVSIKAIVEDTPAVEETVTLTVAERELFISLGTGNELEEPNTTNYVKEYSVFVTDANSNAVENVELSVSAIPETYYKGFWIRTYDGEEFVSWVPAGEGTTAGDDTIAAVFVPPHACSNEDVNFNGILDDGEDENTDGELTPGNIVSVSGDLITDADGNSIIRINYPQSYAKWVDIKLIVSGKVTGTEGATQTIFNLPVLADDVLTEDEPPPLQGINSRSPFGFSAVCTDDISDDPDSN